jgi:two-component system sensor histidine kinase TctE
MFEFDGRRVFYDVTSTAASDLRPSAGCSFPIVSAPGADAAVMGGKPVRVVAIRVRSRPARRWRQRTGRRNDQHAHLLARRSCSTLLPQVILLLFVGLAIWFAVTTAMRSVDDIARRIAGYRPDRPGALPASLPAARTAPAEVRPLLLALHQLVNKLAEAQAGQQRFIANASHQLRTPLAALQVQAERALRESDPVKHSAALESVLKTLKRLRHLSHQLLILARAEPVGDAAITLRELDLAALAREELGQWTDLAIAARADLGYDGPASGVQVQGEPNCCGADRRSGR